MSSEKHTNSTKRLGGLAHCGIINKNNDQLIF